MKAYWGSGGTAPLHISAKNKEGIRIKGACIPEKVAKECIFSVLREKMICVICKNGRLERELQMVQPCATRCSCIAIL
jgi:hypothetical protein